MRRLVLTLAAAVATVLPAGAVGLGPLAKEGFTDGPEKGFWLTLVNPYPQVLDFEAQAIGFDDETPATRVTIIPATARLGGGHDTRLLVVARDLQPGETYAFRVCAMRAQPPAGVTINARVCSKLTAHRLRLPAGMADGGGAG